MNIKKQRKREFKLADERLDDLVLRYMVIEKAIKAYDKDIDKTDKKIEKLKDSKSKKKNEKIAALVNNKMYSNDKKSILITRKRKLQKEILKCKERRELCR